MKYELEKKFKKDVEHIQNKKLVENIKKIIIKIEEANNIREISHVKKLEGYKTYYCIDIGEYRIGLELLDNVAYFTRFLSRKDIYKYFPPR